MIITIIALLIGFGVFEIAGYPGWMGAIVGGSAGAVIGLLRRVLKLESRLDFLQQALAKDWEERHRPESSPVQEALPATEPEPSVDAGSLTAGPIEQAGVMNQAASEDQPLTGSEPVTAEPSQEEAADRVWSEPEKATDDIGSKALQWIKDYFTTGNIFVRIGVLVLFFGVAFLLKYASDNNMLPIEYRLAGAGLGGIALLATGWRLRIKREAYGLLLQGAGVGILYMVVYAAFQMYGLIPAVAAFGLMVAIALFSVVLAVRQDAQSFAIFAVIGGFLAPILASTGDGNYIVLFSYYLILDIVILLVARYRSWRLLNLIGFAFTFIIATAWGVLKYSEAKFATVEPFLLGFFLIYVIVAILYAGQGSLKIRKPLDATLLLANPLATFALQAGMVHQFEYGLAWSAFGFGAFYLVLAKLLWKRGGEDTRLLTEVFLALGVVFASLAIPFALDAQLSAAAWAIEGAGVLWISTRQGQRLAKYFALVLLVGASLLFLSDAETGLRGDNLFSTFILGTSLIGLAWLFSGWLMREGGTEEGPRKSWETLASNLLLGGGVIWWLGGALVRFFDYFPGLQAAHLWLLFLSASTSLLYLLSNRFDWKAGRFAALAQFPGMLLMVLAYIEQDAHPLTGWGMLAWPAAVVALYWLMRSLESRDGDQQVQPLLHAGAFYLVLILVLWEGRYQLTKFFHDNSPWMIAWYAVPMVLGLRFILHWRRWPVSADAKTYDWIVFLSLSGFFALWALMTSAHPGGADPLPYLPVLNPIDLMLIAGGITIFSWLMRQQGLSHIPEEKRSLLRNLLLVLTFIWINVTLFRVMHHWVGHPWDLDSLLRSSQVQMALSILWAVIGVAMMVIASRTQKRIIWLAAAGLLVAVVVKLFLVDLAASGTIARIVSFLIVGGLLILVGYLSPLPPKKEEELESGSVEKQQ